MENPYLEKARRAIDDRIERPAEEIQALALLAIAVELRAIRFRLGEPQRAPVEELPLSPVIDDESTGIIIG